jgi:hypothetical protein
MVVVVVVVVVVIAVVVVIVVVIIVILAVSGVYVTATKIANKARQGPGGANPALILLTGEAVLDKPLSQKLPIVKDYCALFLNANTPWHMCVCRVM